MHHPIAERILFIVDGEVRTPVAVRLFSPQQQPNHWECRFEIGWADGIVKHHAAGHDAMQAIELAMRLIGVHLYTSQAHEAGRLVWEKQGDGMASR